MPKRAKPKPLVPHKPAATAKPSIVKPAATAKPSAVKPAAPKPAAAPRVPDDFETAERRVWDPAASSAAPRELLSGTLRRESLSAEIARGSGLRKLRLAFGERCRAAGVAPLVGAFERWHFGWLLAAADSPSLDPLLPQCAAPAADAELAAELRAAGVSAEPDSNLDESGVDVGDITGDVIMAIVALVQPWENALLPARQEDVRELAP